MTPFISFIVGNEAWAWSPAINLHRKRLEINDPGASIGWLLGAHT
jgi:hypothetical protein